MSIAEDGRRERKSTAGRYRPAMEIRERQIETATLSTGLLECGPADGPLVVCVHGFPDTAWSFRHLLPALAAEGLHAVAPFLRGYAPSAAPDEPHRGNATYAEDLVALVDALGATRPLALVGHDWGAPAVYVASATGALSPRAIVGLAVPPPAPGLALDVSTWGQMRRSWYSFLLARPFGPELLGAGDLELVAQLWADWSPGHDGAEDVARVRAALPTAAHVRLAAAPYAVEDVRALPAGFPAHRARGRVALGAPFLYLHGADDGCMGIDVLDRLRPGLPEDALVEVLPGCGHFLQVERPDAVAAHVVPFVARHLAG